MSDPLRSILPELYRRWLPAFFDRPAIVDTRATCGDCAMCEKRRPPGADAPVPEGFFLPGIKCCSFHPTLANFLVGAALRESSPAASSGRQRLRSKILARTGVTPVWLAAPRKYLVLYDAARESSFGRSESLLCPYFERDSARCSIWAHRESVCTTFFCKHVAGASGLAFWGALQRYLTHSEASLARYAAESVLGRRPVQDLPRTTLTREDLEGRPPDEVSYAGMWGRWVGREEAFYEECGDVVASIGAAEWSRVVDRTGGDDLLADVVARYDAATAPVLAPRLEWNPQLRTTPAPGGVTVTTDGSYDAHFLPREVYDALRTFAADETVDAALSRFRDAGSPLVSRALVLSMQVRGVLTPPSSTPTNLTP
jgi:Fe-S-cluster containining protein